MFGVLRRSLVLRLALALAVLLAVGGVLGAVLDADPSPRQATTSLTSARTAAPARSVAGPSPGTGSGACGSATAATIGSVDTSAALGIYAGEIRSREVSEDRGHVEGSATLGSAMAADDQPAVYEAVHTLVYMPHWHIVRLRVVKAGHVLADVGGPDVIAPVTGTLRWHGRTVGSYVMSVQDDVGYVKLVSRFIGVPVDLYRDGSLLLGTLPGAPSAARTGAVVRVGGTAYDANLLNAQAFPAGALRVALLVPRAAGPQAAASCAAVRLAAWGNVAMRVAARLHPLPAHYGNLVDVLRSTTGGLAFVRSGSRRLAGGAGPAHLPTRGTVRWDGRSWTVFSWEPVPPARVYLLTPSG